MKKIELLFIFSIFISTDLLARTEDPTTRMVAMGLAAVFFYGILALVRGFREKNSHKDWE